jgi:hypothetical protein
VSSRDPRVPLELPASQPSLEASPALPDHVHSDALHDAVTR